MTTFPLPLTLPIISDIIQVLIIDPNESEHEWFGHELIQRFTSFNNDGISMKTIVELFVDTIEPLFRTQLLDWLHTKEQFNNWKQLMHELKNHDYRSPIPTMENATNCECHYCDYCSKDSGIIEAVAYWQHIDDELCKIENMDYDLLSIFMKIHFNGYIEGEV